MSLHPIEVVVDYGQLGCIAAYEERTKLANSDSSHQYMVDEHTNKVGTTYRIVRRRK